MPVAVRRGVLWAATIAWAAVIFALSSTPGSNLPGGYSVQAHFTEYFVLGALVYLALRVDLPVSAALLAIVAASLYGVSDEIHQAFVPMRTPDPVDWLIDTAGVIAGVAAASWMVRLYKGRRTF